MHLMRMQECGYMQAQIGVESKKAASDRYDAMVEDVNTGRRRTSCQLESCCTLSCIGRIPRVNPSNQGRNAPTVWTKLGWGSPCRLQAGDQG
mmetsp:Transcript_6891/g.24511  ORF Transcript_6891/g.24511 Transcript_6891/m.24511 type:complete len:92 (+) Transcript_6891:71-346(+)